MGSLRGPVRRGEGTQEVLSRAADREGAPYPGQGGVAEQSG